MNEVSAWTLRYADFREHDRLRKSLWQEELNGKQVACALGALLDIQPELLDEDGEEVDCITQAKNKACVASQMPDWLIEITPVFFDHKYLTDEYHILWSDLLYLPGGCIDRANKLPRAEREALYAEAEKEIRARYLCNGMKIDNYHSLTHPLFDQGFTGDSGERIAGTIPTVLDELLTAAGV